MNTILLGAAGFIGTNLALAIMKQKDITLTLVDKRTDYFISELQKAEGKVVIVESEMNEHTDFDSLIRGQEQVFHLMSTTVPSTSNQQIPEELTANVVVTAKLLDACVRCGVKKVVFISSGGTVYGKETNCPLKENTPTNPISSYGVQKVTIEKLLYLYHYLYGLDYRIVRLANPYGPYQRPNGVLGAVTTFTYKALKGEKIVVYGDGSVVRDFIYIDDAINGILKIANGTGMHRIYNLGCGRGVSINQVLNAIQKAVETDLQVKYIEARSVDVPVNYLNIERYELDYGPLNPVSLEDGIKKTAKFMRTFYQI